MIDRMASRGHRAVPAGVPRLELKVGINFFAGLNRREQALVLLLLALAAIEVDAVFGVDPIAMLLQQPVDAVIIPPFLVGSQREDQIAIGSETFLFQPDEVRNQDGV